MNSFKPISISLSPNAEKDDVLLAFKLKFQPWRWKKGRAIEELENQFKNYLGMPSISFNSGRSALMAILDSLNLGKGSEVLLQAFTCNAAANPIIWSGLKPVYVDCNERTLNMDCSDLERKISQKSRAVIFQHTFGNPEGIEEVLAVCQKRGLILIEDCAHSLGAELKGKKAGTFGQASFFSFSRDKIISSVYGGMAATSDQILAKRIKDCQEKMGYPSLGWIVQQLKHPILMNWLIIPTYKNLGKYFLVLFQRLRILSKAVHWKEKRGLMPFYFPKRLPNALAILALNQFQKLERFNRRRREIANFYIKELSGAVYNLQDNPNSVYLRFSLFHPRAHQIIRAAWKKNLLIGDWYTSPIVPADTDLVKMQYIPGSCPTAERMAKITFNLPTHINISKEDAKKIVGFLRSFR